MIAVYLAAHYSRKFEIARYAKQLEKMGIKVVSSWYREKAGPDNPFQTSSERNRQRVAKRDKEEVNLCTHLVLFTVSPDIAFTRGGHCWEDGYAEGIGKIRAIVGPKQLLFHWLPKQNRFDCWEDCRDWLLKEFYESGN
jgi:hypothetical protein